MSVPGLLTAGNPQVQAQAFGQTLKSLEVALGSASIKQATAGLGALTGNLNSLSGWMQQHSQVTSVGVAALAGALALLATAGVIAVLTTLGGATGGLAALGAGILSLAAAAKEAERYGFGWDKATARTI